MTDQIHLAVVIVTWNNRNIILDSLRSVYDDLNQSGLIGVVWVVDNQSSDGTPDVIRHAYPNVNLLEPGNNLGFAGGNNYALRAMGFPDEEGLPPYVLLLNPDTIVQLGAFQALITGLEESQAGLAGAKLQYGDGSFQHSAFAFPGLAQLIIDLFPVPGRLIESQINGRYPRAKYESTIPFEVDHPLGATFLLQREVIQNVGMFDEQFWLYCEEIDWAMRIKQADYKVVCVPTAVITHLEGQSTRQVRPESIVNLWQARLKLYCKHYGVLKRWLAIWILRAGMNQKIKSTARDAARTEDERKILIDAYREVIRSSKENVNA